MRLRDSGHTVEALTDRLADMKTQIREWKDEFDVESPNQLRGTLAEEALDADEEARRREIARDWEHLQRRIRIVGFAIREWDFLAPTTKSVEPDRDVAPELDEETAATVDEHSESDVWEEL